MQRTKGIHLSNVIDFIEATDAGRDFIGSTPLSDTGKSFAANGFIWEYLQNKLTQLSPTELWEWLFSLAMIEPVNPNVVRPGEQCLDAGPCPNCKEGWRNKQVCQTCDGTGRLLVYMTPDGLYIDSEGTTDLLEEWKWTTKSCRGMSPSYEPVEASADSPIRGPKFKRWIRWQIPCYLKALGLNTCKLGICFARGDYSSGEPYWYSVILTYSEQEIDETWDCIASNARRMVEVV